VRAGSSTAAALPAGLRVREARGADATVLLDLLARAFGQYEGRLDPPSGAHSETEASIVAWLQSGGALLCEHDAEPVGCVFHACRGGYLYVGRLSVAPPWRRRGIGELLLGAAERRARDLGLPGVRLGVRIVLAELRAWYEARGYTMVGLRSNAGYAQPTFVEMEKRFDAQPDVRT
jgi:GNAT superfamily N-acetyltransferase